MKEALEIRSKEVIVLEGYKKSLKRLITEDADIITDEKETFYCLLKNKIKCKFIVDNFTIEVIEFIKSKEVRKKKILTKGEIDECPYYMRFIDLLEEENEYNEEIIEGIKNGSIIIDFDILKEAVEKIEGTDIVNIGMIITLVRFDRDTGLIENIYRNSVFFKARIIR